MNDVIYLVAYNTYGDTMGQRFAEDADGVKAIVRQHYRRVFGSDAVTIAIDMEALTVVVSHTGFRKSYRILRYRLDKEA